MNYPEKFNLCGLISSVVQDFKNQLKVNKRNLDLVYDDTTTSNCTKEDNKAIIIEADKERIGQVLNNLVDNAIKNTDSGMIIITTNNTNVTNTDIKKNPDSREEIVVKVKDSGKGIDPTLFSKIFSKFFTASEISGTGLGLYVCKAIVEAHEGSLWAENNNGEKGATFSFSLPLQR